jgi:hypothetical protein
MQLLKSDYFSTGPGDHAGPVFSFFMVGKVPRYSMQTRVDPESGTHWRHLLEVFRDAELAEARAEVLKPYLDCLELTGLLEGHVILGEGTLPLHTAPTEGGSDSGLVCQAALLVPGGLGVVLWDSEEYYLVSRTADGLEAGARHNFTPFSTCRPVIQQWLLPQIDGLFQRLFEVASRYSISTPGSRSRDSSSRMLRSGCSTQLITYLRRCHVRGKRE